jgi:hypothetical protein
LVRLAEYGSGCLDGLKRCEHVYRFMADFGSRTTGQGMVSSSPMDLIFTGIDIQSSPRHLSRKGTGVGNDHPVSFHVFVPQFEQGLAFLGVLGGQIV